MDRLPPDKRPRHPPPPGALHDCSPPGATRLRARSRPTPVNRHSARSHFDSRSTAPTCLQAPALESSRLSLQARSQEGRLTPHFRTLGKTESLFQAPGFVDVPFGEAAPLVLHPAALGGEACPRRGPPAR